MPYLDPDTPADVIARFRLYRERFEKLKASKLMSSGNIENTLSFHANGKSNSLSMSLKAPDDETVEYFGTQIRPFVLQKDAPSHFRACNLARQYVAEKGLVSWCDLSRAEFQALMENPQLSGLPVYLGDDRLLSPKETFNLFMEADGPHLFADSAEVMEQAGDWKSILKCNFVGLCTRLYVSPLQLFSDTIGVALGDLKPVDKALAGAPEERIEQARAAHRIGRELIATPLAETPYSFAHVRLGLKRKGAD